MRASLHVERRRAPRKALPLVRDSRRRTRQPRRHGLRTRCGYLPQVAF
jgi:hypothetical protein